MAIGSSKDAIHAAEHAERLAANGACGNEHDEAAAAVSESRTFLVDQDATHRAAMTRALIRKDFAWDFGLLLARVNAAGVSLATARGRCP